MVSLPDYSNSNLDQRSRSQGYFRHYFITKHADDSISKTYQTRLKHGRYDIRGGKSTYMQSGWRHFRSWEVIVIWTWWILENILTTVFPKLLILSGSSVVETLLAVGALHWYKFWLHHFRSGEINALSAWRIFWWNDIFYMASLSYFNCANCTVPKGFHKLLQSIVVHLNLDQ